MTINTQKLRDLVTFDFELPVSVRDAVDDACDHIDAQAAEIARLRSRIAELRVAVQSLLDCQSGIYCDDYQDAEHKARIALQGDRP